MVLRSRVSGGRAELEGRFRDKHLIRKPEHRHEATKGIAKRSVAGSIRNSWVQITRPRTVRRRSRVTSFTR